MANLSIVDRTHSKMLNFMVVLLIHGLNFQNVKLKDYLQNCFSYVQIFNQYWLQLKCTAPIYKDLR